MPELKRKLVPLLGIAFVVAILATGVFYGLFVGELKSATTTIANQTILVASKDLSRGKLLEAADLKVSRWQGSEPLNDAFTQAEQIIGKPLLSNVSQNEPITESKISASAKNVSPMVPKGMRAVSVRIQESSGLMPFLRPGHKVDVQMVSASNALRTILENVEVLAISNPASNVPGSLVSILSLLVTPAEADRVALADATAKLRLLLRNPLDKDINGRSAIELNRVLQETNLQGGAATVASVPTVVASSTPTSPAIPAQQSRVDFQVSVLGANEKGLELLSSKLTTPATQGQLSVSAFRPGSNSDSILRQLTDAKQIELLTNNYYVSTNDRQISAHPGSSWNPSPGVSYGLFLHLQPTANGKSLRLRVQPEVILPQGQEIESRRVVSELNFDSPESFAVTGWTAKNPVQNLLEKLFSQQWKNKDNRELVIIVTPRWQPPAQTIALSRKP